MKKEDIKILISYKNKHKIVETDIIKPIQTGRAIANEIFKGMIGDDTGDNISKENPRYCELTAQYWAWKNYDKIGNPNYIGFMHYRRHFIFDKDFCIKNKVKWHNGIDVYRVDTFDEECIKNLQNENIINTITSDIDCYVFKPYNINLFAKNNMYIKEHYLSRMAGAKRIAWDAFYNTVKDLYPEYEDILNKIVYGNQINFCNMFIMKKNLFFEYNEFLFKILHEVDKKIDSELFTTQEKRFLGYFGEYLLTMFVAKLTEQNIKIKYLDGYYIDNIDKSQWKNKIKEIFQQIFSIKNINQHKVFFILGIKFKFKRKNNNNVTFSKNDYYVLLHEIFVLNNKIADLQQKIIIDDENEKRKNKYIKS